MNKQVKKTSKKGSERKKPPDLYTRSRAQFRNERRFMFQACVLYLSLL